MNATLESKGLPDVRQTREKLFHLRVSEEERQHWQMIADAAGYLSVSDMLRGGVVLVERKLQRH
jgi:hypothetical protein